MKRLGELIRETRHAEGLTLSRLAELAHLSTIYVTEIESGRKIPRRGESLLRLAKVLKLRREELQDAALYSRIRAIGEGVSTGSAVLQFRLADEIIQSEVDLAKFSKIRDIILGRERDEEPSLAGI